MPAHSWAYGEMDKAVGHYRRYTQKMFRSIHNHVAPDAKLILMPFNFYALWGWLVNGRLLGRKKLSMPLVGLFEKLCPFLKIIDNIIIRKMRVPLGNSLIVIQEW